MIRGAAGAAAVLAVGLLIGACGGSAEPTAATVSNSQTWTWNGKAWQQRGGPQPEMRYQPGMAFDAARGVVVMFGGYAAGGFLGDTWTWDGHAWAKHSPAHSPRARGAPAMAYDPLRRLVVMIGGTVRDQGEGTATDEIWTWDGADWAPELQNSVRPPAREGNDLYFDSAAGTLVLIGGRFANLDYFIDRWAWDGKAWTKVAGGDSPEGRNLAAVVYQDASRSLLVSGGQGIRPASGPGGQGRPLADNWQLGAGGWAQLAAVPAPGARYGAAAAYDAGSQQALVFGGYACPKLSRELWAWSGSAWRLLSPAGPSPPAEWGARLVYDPLRKVDLLYAGSTDGGCF
jgi:hypothetical protein